MPSLVNTTPSPSAIEPDESIFTSDPVSNVTRDDFSVAQVSWVEISVARPDEETMDQLSRRMEEAFARIRDHPEPTGRVLPPDLDLLFSAGERWSIFSGLEPLRTARRELTEAEQALYQSMASAGLTRLHGLLYGSSDAPDEGGDIFPEEPVGQDEESAEGSVDGGHENGEGSPGEGSVEEVRENRERRERRESWEEMLIEDDGGAGWHFT